MLAVPLLLLAAALPLVAPAAATDGSELSLAPPYQGAWTSNHCYVPCTTREVADRDTGAMHAEVRLSAATVAGRPPWGESVAVFAQEHLVERATRVTYTAVLDVHAIETFRGLVRVELRVRHDTCLACYGSAAWPLQPGASGEVRAWVDAENHSGGRVPPGLMTVTVTLRAEADARSLTQLATGQEHALADLTMRGIEVSMPRIPDLVVDAVRVAPANDGTDDVFVTTRVTNLGWEPAAAFDVELAREDRSTRSWDPVPFDRARVAGVGAGASVEATVRWSPPLGDWLVVATADVSGEVAETREYNNLGWQRFHHAPDLATAALTLAPEAPHEGETLTFTATIANVGSARANASEAALTVWGRARPPNAPVPSLAPGEEIRVTWTWVANGTGDANAMVIADATGTNAQRTRDNDALSVAFHIHEAPPHALAASPERQHLEVAPRGAATFEIAVTNRGTMPDVVALAHGEPPKGWSASLDVARLELAPGATALVRLTLTAPARAGATASVAVTATSSGDASVAAASVADATVVRA